MSLVMSPDLGYFPPEADEKSRARFCAGRFAAESRARVAGRALAARPAVPARTPAVAPRPARDRRACAKHLRLSCATTAGPAGKGPIAPGKTCRWRIILPAAASGAEAVAVAVARAGIFPVATPRLTVRP